MHKIDLLFDIKNVFFSQTGEGRKAQRRRLL